MRSHLSLLLAAALMLLSCRAPAPVPPGRVTGRLRVDGALGERAPLPTTPIVARVCGATVEDRGIELGAGGLAGALVFVERGEALPPRASPDAVLDQRGCLYVPRVLGARTGELLHVSNSDPLVHTVRGQSAEAPAPVFNVAMPLAGMRIQRRLPEVPAIIPVRCDVHPWMRAHVRTFAHGYFTTTDGEGRFSLTLPPGRHTLVFWHPRWPEARQQVEVAADRDTALEQTFRASAVTAD